MQLRIFIILTVLSFFLISCLKKANKNDIEEYSFKGDKIASVKIFCWCFRYNTIPYNDTTKYGIPTPCYVYQYLEDKDLMGSRFYKGEFKKKSEISGLTKIIMSYDTLIDNKKLKFSDYDVRLVLLLKYKDNTMDTLSYISKDYFLLNNRFFLRYKTSLDSCLNNFLPSIKEDCYSSER